MKRPPREVVERERGHRHRGRRARRELADRRAELDRRRLRAPPRERRQRVGAVRLGGPARVEPEPFRFGKRSGHSRPAAARPSSRSCSRASVSFVVMARSLRASTRARRRRRTSHAAKPSSVSATQQFDVGSPRSRPARNSISACVDPRPAPARELVFDRGPVRGVVHVTDDVEVGRAQRPRRAAGVRPAARGCAQPGRHRAAVRASRPRPRRSPAGNGTGAPRSGSMCTQIAAASTHSTSPTCSCVRALGPARPDAAAPRRAASTSARNRGVRAMRSSSRRRIHSPCRRSAPLDASSSATSCTMRASASSRVRRVGPHVGEPDRAVDVT